MMLRSLRTCAANLFFLSASALAAPLPHNQQTVTGMSKAYGFLLGQEMSLDRVEKTFPSAAGQVEMARLGFNAKFPDMKAKLEAEMRAALKDKYGAYRDEMLKQIPASLAKQQMTQDVAERFLKIVEARAKGEEIDPEVLRYMLAVQYAKNPAGEFAGGFQQRYRTDGTGKSVGVRLSLRLPRSWQGKDGERPHILQKWVSAGGTETGMYMLYVKDSGEKVDPTRRELEELVRTGEVNEFVEEGGKVNAAGVVHLERRNALWIDTSIRMERAGFLMYQRGTIHYVFTDGKVVGLFCQVITDEKDAKKADANFNEIKPLCNLILNSLVLEQVY